MKSSRKTLIKTSLLGATSFPRFLRKGRVLKGFLLLGCLAGGLMAARAAMPDWVQNIEVRSLVEAAIFRTVPLPAGPITIRRPPAESVPALGELLKQHPQQADCTR